MKGAACMKNTKSLLLTILSILLIVLYIFWYNTNRTFTINPDNITKINISNGNNKLLKTYTDQETIEKFTDYMNEINYKGPFVNNRKGYYYLIEFYNEKGEEIQGKNLRILTPTRIQRNFFAYQVTDESLDTLISFITENN